MNGFEKNKRYYTDPERTRKEVDEELAEALDMLAGIDGHIVGVFGSHITPRGSPEFDHCKAVAKLLGEHGVGIVSGGGPGIMQAANEGAMESGAPSIGLRMSSLKNEAVDSDPYTQVLDFKYMMVRRFALHIRSGALIFYPGGFGTLNELFEYTVLIQTGLVDEVPVILVNKEFWEGMLDWVQDQLVTRKLLTHDEKDLSLLHRADTPEEILDIILGADR